MFFTVDTLPAGHARRVIAQQVAGAAERYAFIPLVLMPSTMYFWKVKNIRTGGNRESVNMEKITRGEVEASDQKNEAGPGSDFKPKNIQSQRRLMYESH